jgi:hypothetical protein
MNKLALIIAYFLPKEVKYTAVLDWMDDLPACTLVVEDPAYTLRLEKTLKKKEKHG